MQFFTMRPGTVSAPVYKPVPQTCPDPGLPRDIASRFGRRVRELRQAKQMTQMEVAVTFGIDRTFISDVERGRKSVCLPTMEVFALGFGVSLSDLLRGL
ncbi:MAG: helix-turn-helix transcriptional regulator [Rhodospirillales bacterium]|nr:helix-turn-helix transcriptional regulator [Acetobacter sp.]